MDDRQDTPPGALNPNIVSGLADAPAPLWPLGEAGLTIAPWYVGVSDPVPIAFSGELTEVAEVQDLDPGLSRDSASRERTVRSEAEQPVPEPDGFPSGAETVRPALSEARSAPVEFAPSTPVATVSYSFGKSDTGDAEAPSLTRAFVPTDDLFINQWHLLNTGQFVGSVAGIDIDVTDVWDDYTGAGIRVGVVDDGVQYTHHDLNDNYNPSGQFDYGGNDADPFPTSADRHGTAVAGLIASENNGSGTVGVVFDASVTAFRIFGGTVTESEFADTYNRHAAELDISNNSWGYNGFFFFDNLDGPNFDAVGAAIESAAAIGRGGLGTVMLWAAGNDRLEGQNVNYHGFQNARETIAVAAIDNQGDIAGYSTPGAAILIGAPSNGGSAAITTTDLLGTSGYASGDYTFGFGGTSAATPITAGAVALILESNPLLGYRDVQEILAYTARQVDVNDPSWAFNGAHNWNGGGLHTSHDFGFGLIDTHAAVRLAETWTTQATAANEGLVTATSAPNMALVDNGTIFDTISIGSGIDIEHVEVVLDLVHTFIGDLVITLTSPDGTQSVLVDRPGLFSGNPDGSSQNNIDFTLSSTNHWGETGVGDWTLEVQDAAAQDTGLLVSWTLNLFGTPLDGDDLYVYTDEFGGFTNDLGRQILSDAAGSDTINAAAIRADSVIDLTDGSDSTLAGNTLTIEAGTVIEDAYSGDGDDQLVGNAVDNVLSAGRGDDTLSGGGNDTLDGGLGDDLFLIGTGDGDDVIQGFVAGAGIGDQIDLQARSDVTDFAELLALASDNGTDTSIAFANGDSLLLSGVLEAELAANDFLFASGSNGAPTATADIVAATEDTPETILASTLLSNDTDPDGDPLTLQSVQNAVNGTAVLDGNGDVLFMPDANFNGAASFDYTVSDGNGGTDTATVTVNVAAVNDPPAATADIVAATEDIPETILAATLLSNDTDPDGDPLTLQSVQNAVNGTAVLDGNGDVLFTPDAGFSGAASCDYTVSDGNGGTDTATVSVDVAAANAGETLIGTGGKDTLTGGAGDDVIEGLGKDDVLTGNGGNDVFLYSGTNTGFDSVSGGAGIDRIEGSAGDDVIGLRSIDGIEEIDGGLGVNVISGDYFHDVFDFSGVTLTNIASIEGGGGRDTITGSSGDDIIAGGTKDDRFVFGDGAGNDTITDFAAGASTDDAIDFSAVSEISDFGDVQANASDNGADTVIQFDGGSVTLIGVQVANLHEDDFIF